MRKVTAILFILIFGALVAWYVPVYQLYQMGWREASLACLLQPEDVLSEVACLAVPPFSYIAMSVIGIGLSVIFCLFILSRKISRGQKGMVMLIGLLAITYGNFRLLLIPTLKVEAFIALARKHVDPNPTGFVKYLSPTAYSFYALIPESIQMEIYSEVVPDSAQNQNTAEESVVSHSLLNMVLGGSKESIKISYSAPYPIRWEHLGSHFSITGAELGPFNAELGKKSDPYYDENRGAWAPLMNRVLRVLMFRIKIETTSDIKVKQAERCLVVNIRQVGGSGSEEIKPLFPRGQSLVGDSRNPIFFESWSKPFGGCDYQLGTTYDDQLVIFDASEAKEEFTFRVHNVPEMQFTAHIKNQVISLVPRALPNESTLVSTDPSSGDPAALLQADYRGAVNTKVGITWHLKRVDMKLEGTGSYNSIGKQLTYEGTLADDGSVELYEYYPPGTVTGIFSGKATVASAPSPTMPVTIQGMYRRPDGTHKLPFEVKLVR